MPAEWTSILWNIVRFIIYLMIPILAAWTGYVSLRHHERPMSYISLVISLVGIIYAGSSSPALDTKIWIVQCSCAVICMLLVLANAIHLVRKP